MNKYEKAYYDVTILHNQNHSHMILLKELVERATPREVKIHFRNNIPIAYTCYICDTKTRHFGQLFCLECGQALKWSDSE